ncbi:MAG TPA: FecR domain-containing protein [Verrucomicrobiae bacterium]|jgi:Tfp pilus assembly protein PilF
MIGMAFLCATLFSSASAAPVPNDQSTVLVSFEGQVEVLPAGSTNWTTAVVGQQLAGGYQLRTGPKSRALLRLSNLSVLRVGELMEYQLEPAQNENGKPTLHVSSGAAYFFSREQPEQIQFDTAVASGAIRGTEFALNVAADGRTTVALMDGAVDLANHQGSISLSSGDEAVIDAGAAPRKTAMLDAANIIQWTLYYPAILDPAELGLDAAHQQILSGSLAAYRSGDLPGALREYPAGRQPDSPAEKIYYANLLLSAGLVDQCEAQLPSTSTGADNLSRLADATRELIAAVKFKEWRRTGGPQLATEWLAESYYLQSRSQLPQALDAAQKAAAIAPDSGFAWERVAELEFSFGHTARASEALNKSVALSPRNAQALALTGFLFSADNKMTDARSAFDRAIQLDGALANAWLGRGLCEIHSGNIQAGRKDLQIAAALEPDRSVLRSYLGKAFADVHDDARAEHELQLARKLDPNDPTSLLYLALMHQQQNQINEAIRELQNSEALNDNRSVYRSRLLLDEDEAVRGANLATIYQDAGMTQVAMREAVHAVNDDYANYSAHLFLANSYDQLRDPNQVNLRYETPWYSEYLVANLLAPVGANTLSQNVSQQEYAKLFSHDGVGVASDTTYLSRGAWREAGSQYGTFGNIAYAVDFDYLSDPGQQANNQQEQLTLSAEIKDQLTAQDSVFGQVTYYNATAGDLNQYYNPASANPGLQTKETQTPLAIIGYHHEFSPGSHFLALAGRFQDTSQFTNPITPILMLARDGSGNIVGVPTPGLPTAAENYHNDLVIYSAEAQQILESGDFSVIAGARYQYGQFNTQSALGASTSTLFGNTSTIFFGVPPLASSSLNQNDVSVMQRADTYGYLSLGGDGPLQLFLGGSFDWLHYPDDYLNPPLVSGAKNESELSPKAGFIWTPAKDTVVRFAYTRSLGGVSLDESVRLEPSQFAGFNQAYRSLIPETVAGSISGAKFETFGLALDQKFSTDTYLGIEGDWLNSDAGRTVGDFDAYSSQPFVPDSTPQNLKYTEKDLLVTLNQLLGDWWSVGATYQLSDATLRTIYPQIPASVSSANDVKNSALLSQADMFVLFNHSSGFYARADALWYGQKNYDYSPSLPGDYFWQFNLYGGYRFWHRQAQLQVGLLNIANQNYQLNPLNLYSDIPRSRTLEASFQFYF